MTSAALVLASTNVRPVPMVPEIMLHQASEAIGLWEETERRAGMTGLAPPFWAFAWAGGRALARYILDHREVVVGRRVLDLAAGSGLVAIAAALAGADGVTAADIDELAIAAIGLNAAANGVTVTPELSDLLDSTADRRAAFDVVLAGDVCYDRRMTDRMLAYLDRARDRGALVLIGDPGRSYLPRARLIPLASYDTPVDRELENADLKRATVWRLVPGQVRE